MRQSAEQNFGVAAGLLNLSGAVLDSRYQIARRMTGGAYAEIFLGRDLAAVDGGERLVVIKALNPWLQGEPEEGLTETLLENLRIEAEALARLDHPNVIGCDGRGMARDLDGREFHYLALEFAMGGTLAALCQERNLAPDEALQILKQICAALDHAHRRGVLHRDLKPDNVLLAADRRTVKLADFGVARVDRWSGLVTKVGSEIYAAPEHFSLADEAQELTPAADVYALAKLSYRVFFQTAPRRFAQRQLSNFPPEFAAQPWGLSLLRVLKRATSPEPTKRQQSVAEFWAELEEAWRSATEEEMTQVRVRSREPEWRRRIWVPVGNEESKERQTEERPAKRVHARLLAGKIARWLAAGRRLTVKRGVKPMRKLGIVIVVLLVLLAVIYQPALKSAVSKAAVWLRQPKVEAVGRKGVTTTDVNLRLEASANHPPLGLAERASRVRILAMNEDWYLVEVLCHGRPKVDPKSHDKGWVRAKYIIVDPDGAAAQLDQGCR